VTDSNRGAIALAPIGQATMALVRNLAGGMVLMLFLPRRLLKTTDTLGQLLLLIGTLWGVQLCRDLIDAWPNPAFNVWGVLAAATRSYAWLTILCLVALVNQRPERFLAMAVPAAAAIVTISVVWIGALYAWSALDPESLDTHYMKLWMAGFAWEAAVVTRVVLIRFESSHLKALVTAAMYGGLLYGAITVLPDRPLFYPERESAAANRIDVERVYYSQPNLLKHALHKIDVGTPDSIDLYFIGFGGYGSQDVFKREVEQARAIIEQQYGARGRTVTLLNNYETVRSAPLANLHNLNKSIQVVAQRMNLEEDILLLFLTSHGSDDGSISVQLPPLGLNDIDADEIREILDNFQVKWRIVILSACYSGSFIDALESPQTLIITAAAADRASFGCSHEREWTYFGEAFFNQALKDSPSFVAAFDHTAKIIEQREIKEGKEPSTPQISIGIEIKPYLEKFLDQREHRHAHKTKAVDTEL
jgi:hypothetical protein